MFLRSIAPAIRRPRDIFNRLFHHPNLRLFRRCAASASAFVFPVPVFLVPILLALASSQAYAGSYIGVYTDPVTNAVIPYTGGQFNVPGPTGQPTSYPYRMSSSGYGGASGGITASCTGAITASWKWQPASGMTMTTDPPPAQVVVMEGCSVAVTVVSPAATGSYDTGMGKSGSVTWTPGGNNTRTATSVRYTPHAGGASVTLPAVNASAVAASPGDTGSVYYTASLSPVFVTPGGAIKDSSGVYNILVGQSCTGSLSSLPCPLSNYQWSVSGTTFQSWTVSADQSHTTEVDGPGPLNMATAHWYWNDNNGSGKSKVEQVSCSATLTPPADQGSPFTVSATTPVTVWVPKWTSVGIGGAIYVVNHASGGSANYWLQAAANPGSGNTGGMDWWSTVASPLTSLFGNGTIQIVQLVIPGFSFRAEGVNYHLSNNGQEGLDTTYPYGWVQGAPNYFSNDSPGFSLTTTVAGSEASSGTHQEQFEDYLLYTPPGSGQCVPLAHFVWTTNGSAAEPYRGSTYSWSFYGPGSAGPVTPGAPTNFLQMNAFPSWTENSGNGTSYWVQG